MAGYSSFGTQVYVKSNGNVVIVHPADKNFTPDKGMVKLCCVRGCTINIPLGGLITASLEIIPEMFYTMECTPIYHEKHWYDSIRRIFNEVKK